MRLPRFRLRTLMIAVVAVALLSTKVARDLLDDETHQKLFIQASRFCWNLPPQVYVQGCLALVILGFIVPLLNYGIARLHPRREGAPISARRLAVQGLASVLVIAAALGGYLAGVGAERRRFVGPEYRALVWVRSDDSEPTGALLNYSWYDVNTREGAARFREREARLRADRYWRYYVVRGRMMIVDQVPPGRPESVDLRP